MQSSIIQQGTEKIDTLSQMESIDRVGILAKSLVCANETVRRAAREAYIELFGREPPSHERTFGFSKDQK